MKKNNNSEDIKDDSDELRKKKPTSDVVTDQMVPVPENTSFRDKERDEVKSTNDEGSKEYLSFENKECNNILEIHDPLYVSCMYEDVNSPEDFDDYDHEDTQECCSEENAVRDRCEVVNGSQKSSDAVESIQKCYNTEETTLNCFDSGQSVQNSVDVGNDPENCFDEGKTEQNTFDVREVTQDSFDAGETTQNHFNTGETTQDCLVAGEAPKDCFDESEQRFCDTTEPAENSKKDYEEENYIVEETFDVNAASASYDQDQGSAENYPAERVQELFVTEDSSLPPSDDDLIHGDMSPIMEAAPICSVASVDDEIDGDTEEQVGGDEGGNTEVINYTFNTEEEGVNDKVQLEENFAEALEDRDIVPEVEDVTCDSGGETVLVMKHEVCSEECDVSKPNLCPKEEMIYTDHLNSIQDVDEMVFHKRSTVIDTGNVCASLHVSDNSVMKCEDNSLVCKLPRREAAVVRYCENYETVGVNSVFPKRVCNSVCISPVPQPPAVRELYVYDPSAQNMTFCRNSAIIDARSLPVNPNVNGLDSYSFHHVPIEPSSTIKNVNDIYGHTNAGLCPVLQESRLGFDNRDTKPTKKLPTEEDFMRRIEKTLFESKMETKIDDAIDSKYKAELDLSLPLKKRLRTLAAMSSMSCTSEKFVTPKEESFPSYPAMPMISIAELEFARKDLQETHTKTIISDHINKL